jgi:hypothetical protein
VIPPGTLASAIGAAPGSATATPNMIGDSLNSGMRIFGAGALSLVIPFEGTSVGLSGGDRRFKIADDENPLPIDRIFVNYNHFQNPVQDIYGGQRNLERITFGAEKTFRDGLWSVGLRVPFSADYNATQSTVDGANLSATEFGDMTLVVKRALIQREHFALSAGLGFVFPSGADWKVVDGTGTLVEVWNESVHIDPFLGAIWSPTDRLFFLCFGQLDFDTHGDTVLMRDAYGTPGTLGIRGVFNEQTLGTLDLSVGYRLYQNPYARFLTGITPMAELHYTTTLQNMDFVSGPLGNIGATNAGGAGRRDVLNLTGGVNLQLGPLSSLTIAGVAPLKTGDDREFDSEFVVQFDRRF